MPELITKFATFPVLETERCVLRAVTPADVPDMFRIMSDASVSRYLGRPPMSSIEDAERRVQSYQKTLDEENGVPWGITHRVTGQFMGTCVFWNLIPEHFRAELGYILAPEWWGQGIVTEVATAVLNFGFHTMQLHSVEAQIDPANKASQRVLEKLGFVQEAYYRENFYLTDIGEFGDTAVFSLLKSTWVERHQAS